MQFKDLIQSAFKSLLVNKGRAFLTILGIVIGIASIMIVMSIGQSAEQLIIREVQSFGPENVYVNPGKPSDGLFQSASFLSKTLVERDMNSLKEKGNVPDAVRVVPSVNASVKVSYEGEMKTVSLLGSGAGVFDIYNISLVRGRFYTEDEVQDKAAVIVIGKNVVKDLFGSESFDPVGEKIKIKETNYKIVGVFSSTGSSMFGIDDLVVAPYTTVQQYTLGSRHFHEIAVQASSAEKVPSMVNDIKRTLRDNHNIDDPKDDDFMVNTQEDIIKSVESILNAVTIFLMLVAAISLLVGGVGVMNIMFVSVTERTREIGLRKALGARNSDILRQFLFESLFLTAGGGILGVAIGALVTFFIVLTASFLTGTHYPFLFSVSGAIAGILVAGGTGILFGIFPALNAAKKSPVESLRYE